MIFNKPVFFGGKIDPEKLANSLPPGVLNNFQKNLILNPPTENPTAHQPRIKRPRSAAVRTAGR